ncbi:MAG TPA: LysM peptidoglycan-binding domain-containing protein, partial [Clostridiales bacterium]|nr:LysM peptidoglycan-binding domain-containing protein [Clostridiales bacterium]
MTQRRCPPFTEPYTIQPGDTLYKIAMERNTTPAMIQFLNPFITSPYSLVVGQIICVPAKGNRPPCPNGFYYTIKCGDTFYKIAEQYGITVRELQAANPFANPYNLMIGQVICVPRRAINCPGGKIHIIQQGDTLLKIAQQYDISYNALVAANPGVQPENLQIGQQLCIPPHEPAQLCPAGRQYT